MLRPSSILVLALVVGCGAPPASAPSELAAAAGAPLDLVIANGRVVDGIPL